jgi:hypothetical protein
VEPVRENAIRSKFRGETRDYTFFVHAESIYLVVAVVPYQRLPIDESSAHRLMDRLLQLNDEMVFAKYSVDEDGDVILSVEYPLAHLDKSDLRDALDVLTYYANKHWPELMQLGAPTTAP